MYLGEKLCVPEDGITPVLAAQQSHFAHIGVSRMVAEATRRYAFPPACSLLTCAKAVKRACLVCQACEPPNLELEGLFRMIPVPDRIFEHVCVDIFSMPETKWQGEMYDCFLLCVDRLSGWMVARPTTKLGLTAEKAARLLLDGGWDIWGIPSTITSDQGPQFVGKWFQTMCARLGVRQAFSQAHRPQGNGRAEVAGRQIITLLRKMHAESQVDWVEALP